MDQNKLIALADELEKVLSEEQRTALVELLTEGLNTMLLLDAKVCLAQNLLKKMRNHPIIEQHANNQQKAVIDLALEVLALDAITEETARPVFEKLRLLNATPWGSA